MNRLEVRGVPGKGRGVFAAAAFHAGELVDLSHTVELAGPDTRALVGTVVDDYPFAHPEDPERSLLVLGLASLMNHTDEANTETVTRRGDGIGWVVEIRAVRDIAPGEEITRRYACELWFDAGGAAQGPG